MYRYFQHRIWADYTMWKVRMSLFVWRLPYRFTLKYCKMSPLWQGEWLYWSLTISPPKMSSSNFWFDSIFKVFQYCSKFVKLLPECQTTWIRMRRRFIRIQLRVFPQPIGNASASVPNGKKMPRCLWVWEKMCRINFIGKNCLLLPKIII